MSRTRQPRIALTMGDPRGIGAEIIGKALPRFRNQADFLVYGDAALTQQLKSGEGISISVNRESSEKWDAQSAGAASVAYLEAAMEAWSRGKWDALVTAPISKYNVKQAGFAFPGHTEYLAQKTGTEDFAMMMAGPQLRVVLVTIHEPLKNVSALLTQNKISTSIRLAYEAVETILKNTVSSFEKPRIAVCALNPHAGEQGLLGSEEIEIIQPAIAAANSAGYYCSGPAVPDRVFYEALQGEWDCVVCMYHDQGLIPFKMMHFDDGVNVTLGLPFVRTSPDHGTAEDIAGQGIASSASMEAAIEFALQACQTKTQN